jgi:acetylornithine deacetylase/succinyl-diaminopimelate desuccinylase-like protein
MGLPLGAVVGTVGVERHVIRFKGQAAHSGSTPMDKRRDALLAAGKMSQEIYAIANRHRGVCTIGSCKTRPGIVTSVVAECEITLDQRHLEVEHLAAIWKEARQAAERFAAEGGVGLEFELLMQIEPILFHPDLVNLAERAINDTCGVSCRLPSGPLHDACEMARAGVPTVMLFVQSLGGISHNRIEDTEERHLEDSVRALDRLSDLTTDWITSRPRV